jgi:hypothetical protein
MQICDEIIELLLVKRVALRRHHPAAIHDRLLDEPVVRRQPARQELLLVESLEARPLAPRRRIRIVARRAVVIEKLPPVRLLRVQSELRIRFRPRIAAPRDENRQRPTQHKPARGKCLRPHRSIILARAATVHRADATASVSPAKRSRRRRPHAGSNSSLGWGLSLKHAHRRSEGWPSRAAGQSGMPTRLTMAW